MSAGFQIQCNNCGGFDLTDIEGRYTHKHNCESLNTNQILLRIAKALEDCHCNRCWGQK